MPPFLSDVDFFFFAKLQLQLAFIEKFIVVDPLSITHLQHRMCVCHFANHTPRGIQMNEDLLLPKRYSNSSLRPLKVRARRSEASLQDERRGSTKRLSRERLQSRDGSISEGSWRRKLGYGLSPDSGRLRSFSPGLLPSEFAPRFYRRRAAVRRRGPACRTRPQSPHRNDASARAYPGQLPDARRSLRKSGGMRTGPHRGLRPFPRRASKPGSENGPDLWGEARWCHANERPEKASHLPARELIASNSQAARAGQGARRLQAQHLRPRSS